jgi:ammonium transporter, Amt family
MHFSSTLLYVKGLSFNGGSALLLPGDIGNGSIAGVAVANSVLCGSGGAIAALFLNLFLQERKTGEKSYDVIHTMNGCLGGLVASTSVAALVEKWAALLIGLVAGALYLGSHHFLIRQRIDDAVDAIPVHFVCGAWSVIASGLFAAPHLVLDAYGQDAHVGFFYELGRGSFDVSLLGAQFIELLFIFGWVLATMVPFFLFLNYCGLFRVQLIEEVAGLDATYHGLNAVGFDTDGAGLSNSGGSVTNEEQKISQEHSKKGKMIEIPTENRSG